MANNQKNVQPKVVTTTTTTTRRRGGRRRRRTPRTSQAGTTTVRKVTTTRQPGRPRRGRRNRYGAPGKSAPNGIRQRITATLGTVGSNQGNSIELETSVLLNPALMKETTGSNQHGPLQIYASTYSLWKIESILLKLTPLVGPSAVSGTAIRASYNPSGQPGSSSWSALGARKHKDTNPGKALYFYLNGSDFRGPKDGWYFCNTKNDPQMCTAGSIEIHTLGQTVSTYQDKQFVGPLFLAEMTCTWSFKGYNPQPGMLNLVKAELKEQPQQVKIHSRPGEPIVISVPNDSLFARTVGGVDLGVDASATPSDIIWMVADTTMDAITGVFPQPFSWLFRAGWWFLKRIANRKKNGDTEEGVPDAGELTFQVFQSMTDAMNNTPCIATSAADTMNANVTGWNITQVTPGNVGQPTATAMIPRVIGLDISRPFYLARTRVATGESVLTGLNFNEKYGIPLNGFAVEDVKTKKKAHSYYSYELIEPYFYQDAQINSRCAYLPTSEKTSQQFHTTGYSLWYFWDNNYWWQCDTLDSCFVACRWNDNSVEAARWWCQFGIFHLTPRTYTSRWLPNNNIHYTSGKVKKPWTNTHSHWEGKVVYNTFYGNKWESGGHKLWCELSLTNSTIYWPNVQYCSNHGALQHRFSAYLRYTSWVQLSNSRLYHCNFFNGSTDSPAGIGREGNPGLDPSTTFAPRLQRHATIRRSGGRGATGSSWRQRAPERHQKLGSIWPKKETTNTIFTDRRRRGGGLRGFRFRRIRLCRTSCCDLKFTYSRSLGSLWSSETKGSQSGTGNQCCPSCIPPPCSRSQGCGIPKCHGRWTLATYGALSRVGGRFRFSFLICSYL
nr:ORF2 [Mamastrovirus 3]